MAGQITDIYSGKSEDDFTALTTNAVAQNIKEYPVSPFECGQLEIYYCGADKAGNFVNGVKYIRYNKNNLQVLAFTAKDLAANQADPQIAGANFNVVSLNQNLMLQVTGAAAVTMGWFIHVVRIVLSMNAF